MFRSEDRFTTLYNALQRFQRLYNAFKGFQMLYIAFKGFTTLYNRGAETMKYNTVVIDRYSHTVQFTKSDVDRVNTKTQPSPLGFYHYPETMTDEEAFKRLKAFLIKIQKEAIKDAQEEIENLEAVAMGDCD
jgi:hypothetical protein